MCTFIRLLTCVAGSLAGTSTLADTVYLWTDDQGLRHFSNVAPASPRADRRVLRLEPAPATAGGGLRPAERQALQGLQHRDRLRQQRSQAARRRSDHLRDRQKQRCTDHRKKLHTARGKESFKKHARYLRSHCW